MGPAFAVVSLVPKNALAQQASSTAQKQPNIALMLVDDLGYGDLGSFGGRAIRTPNLDKMAREGAIDLRHDHCALACHRRAIA